THEAQLFIPHHGKVPPAYCSLCSCSRQSRDAALICLVSQPSEKLSPELSKTTAACVPPRFRGLGIRRLQKVKPGLGVQPGSSRPSPKLPGAPALRADPEVPLWDRLTHARGASPATHPRSANEPDGQSAAVDEELGRGGARRSRSETVGGSAGLTPTPYTSTGGARAPRALRGQQGNRGRVETRQLAWLAGFGRAGRVQREGDLGLLNPAHPSRPMQATVLPGSPPWEVVGCGPAMSLVLLSLATLCWGAVSPEPVIQCGSETGPSPEWWIHHPLTPGDLRDLRVEPIKSNVSNENYSILMNISWILRADASILFLNATKICVTGHKNFQSYSCVRCNYTEPFQTQTRPSGDKYFRNSGVHCFAFQWTFSYTGFPVELNTLYFIGAHNIPTANMNEDTPSMSVNFTSPGCLDHVMKYKEECIKGGSLWDPNITACKKNETMVEVNFTTSPLGNRYMAFIQSSTGFGDPKMLESNQTYTSVVIPVAGESEGAVVQLIPYFHTCGNDCIRRKGTVELCPQTGAPFQPESSTSVSGSWLYLLLPALLVATWMLGIGLYLMWRHERVKKISYPNTTLLPPIKVLVVYPSEVCFQHTVCCFTEFLQNHCRSEVILEKWQKKKIAEMGPVQWLTTQKKAVDKVIFLLSNDVSPMCDGTCGRSQGRSHENAQDLFPLAYNLFCSDLRSQNHLHKYMVVHFREGDTKDDYNALNVCPKYLLMKDASTFRTELLHVKQHVSVGERLLVCHNHCSL
ncbi:LOW QUALITY PROTEIN: Interleukin-17 receptor B, partial [Galemys pyrenaicus]